MAVNRQCPQGARAQGVSLMSDHGCQPAATAFRQAGATVGLQQAFTSDNTPQGHADTERFMRTLAGECLWRQDWTGPVELMRARKDGVAGYNEGDLHAALGYQSPSQCERAALNHHSSAPSAAA
jgi:transposase InsO family protein